MKLYRRVAPDEAERTLTGGFEDHRGDYGVGQEFEGVWVSDVPLDAIDFGDVRKTVLLEIELPLAESVIADYEWIEEGKPYREWLIPAAVLNTHSKVGLVTDNEGDVPDRPVE